MEAMGADLGLGLPPASTVDIDGPVHYREWSGPPGRTFVLVHGLGGSHINWWQVAPGLSELGRVLALDLPGFGSTPRAGRRSDLRANCLVLSRFLADVVAAPAVIVGNSMGGSLALLEAALEPDAVEALVLSSGALPRVGGIQQPLVTRVGFNLYRPPGIGELFGYWRLKGLTAERTTELGFWLIAGDPQALDERTWSSQLEMTRLQQRDPDAIPAFLQAVRSLFRLGANTRTAQQILDRVECPVLVLHGGRDKLVPLGWARAAARQHTGWTFRDFPNAGHAIQLEEPDAWLDAVRGWVEGLPAR